MLTGAQERRCKIRLRQKISQDTEGTELQSLSTNSFADAISHAFQQADAGFLTNGGALPVASGTEPAQQDQGLFSPPRPWMTLSDQEPMATL